MNVRNDIRYALRTLAKNPGYAAVAVLTLALGIGANSAVFSAFDQVILQLLPVENPRELVLVEIDGPHVSGMSMADNMHTVHSHPQYLDYKERSHAFSGVAARTFAPAALAYKGEGERVTGEMVSGNFFEVLGVKPAAGRLFTEEDDFVEGGHPVTVISHGFWQEKFGGREDIIGQDLTVNGQPMTVIGVTAPNFHGFLSDQSPDVYFTLAMRRQILSGIYRRIRDLSERQVRHINIVGRLNPGLSAEQAQAAMQGVFQGILDDEIAELGTKVRDEEEYRDRTIALTPAMQGIHNLREQVEEPLISVMALVGLVLLIACVNVAGLLTARALARGRELAVRVAIGAGRGAIVRQVMIESFVLAIAGGLAGLLVAGWATELLNSWIGDDGGPEIGLNGRVLLFNFGLALVTGLLFGLLPAFQATRVDLASTLKDQTAGAGAAKRHTVFRRGLVVAQVSLSLLLLVAAGLFARTLFNLQNLDPGFRTDSLLAFSLDPGLNGYNTERGTAFYDDLQRRLTQLPGVREAAGSEIPVLTNANRGSGVSVEGYQPGEDEDVGTSRNTVTPGYFRTLGIPVVLGREFDERDTAGSQKVAIVNERFVQRYFKGENPLGRRMSFRSGKSGDDLEMEIIGVVKNQKSADLREELKTFTYTPHTQVPGVPPLTFYALTEREEASVGPDVRRVVRELDPDLPVFQMQTVTTVRDEAVELERIVALLATSFAGIATVLAAIGLYGLMAYGVARRTREIGLRVALGAQRADVLGMVFREALLYLVFGLVIGIPVALALGVYLESQLFGLSARDPLVIVGAALALSAAVMIAALAPARRAAKVNPVVALRYE